MLLNLCYTCTHKEEPKGSLRELRQMKRGRRSKAFRQNKRWRNYQHARMYENTIFAPISGYEIYLVNLYRNQNYN